MSPDAPDPDQVEKDAFAAAQARLDAAASQSPSSILAALAIQAVPKLAPAVGARVEAWTKMLVDAAERDLISKLPASTQGLAYAALEVVRQNESVIADTTAKGFVAIVTHLALGKDDQAREVWLQTAAPFDDLMKALDEDSGATRSERQARELRWGSIKSVAEDFLIAGGKAAIPLLLALVPL